MAEANKKKTHVGVFTSPGIGHLVPFCELARRLSADFDCKVTFILFDSTLASRHAAQFIECLRRTAPALCIASVPAVQVQDENMPLEARIVQTVDSAVNHVLHILASAKAGEEPISAFVADLFCTSLIEPVKQELGIPTYLFIANAASVVTVMFEAPTLVSRISVPLKEFEYGIQLPGLPAIPARDLPTPILHNSGADFDASIMTYGRLRNAHGILINSFQDLEGAAVEAFKHRWKKIISRVYNVGPLISEAGDSQTDFAGIKWLDQQPPASVVFVSFGSGAALPAEQLAEIAEGLEASGQRFLWVVRKKLLKSTASTYFSIPDTDVAEVLPAGFLDRTKDRGLVVPSWAPQVAVLAHPATGGFVSHCGWNSTIESIWHGVPVITWPMFAEQRTNAVMIREAFGTGIGLEAEMDGFVRAAEVEKSVRELMEGQRGRRVREKSAEMKVRARRALGCGGSSWKDLASVVAAWT